MNTKFAIATTVMTAAIAMTSTAEAGVRIGFGFPIGAMVLHKNMEAQEYERRQRAYQAAKAEEAARIKRQQAIAAAKARQQKAKAIAAAKADKADEIAAAKARVAARAQANANAASEQAKTEPVVATATATPSTTATVAAAPANVKTAANTTTTANTTNAGGKATNETATKLECKRYFANVGLTISVPCEN
ncbi:hypothetical protein ACO2I3_04220 [Leptospira interrogans]